MGNEAESEQGILVDDCETRDRSVSDCEIGTSSDSPSLPWPSLSVRFEQI